MIAHDPLGRDRITFAFTTLDHTQNALTLPLSYCCAQP